VKEFADKEGTRWQVSLTVASAMRVRDLVTVVPPPMDEGEAAPPGPKPFDLIDASRIAETFQILRSNYAAIGETLYAVLLPQIEKRELSREEFLDRLSGESLDAGARALEEEIVSFFPPRLRSMIAALARKMDELTEAVTAKAQETVEALAIPGTPSGSPPESSGSIPESGPSVS
jgi:hypothetical protein